MLKPFKPKECGIVYSIWSVSVAVCNTISCSNFDDILWYHVTSVLIPNRRRVMGVCWSETIRSEQLWKGRIQMSVELEIQQRRWRWIAQLLYTTTLDVPQ